MTRARSMTIPRQIVAALTVSVLVTLAVIAIALLFLDRVSDARQRLVDTESRQVIDAYALELSVAERGVALRNLLITGEEEYRTRLEDAETEYQAAMGRLQRNIPDDEGRALLDAVAATKAALDEVTDSAVAARLEGAIVPGDLSDLLAQQLTPARRALTGAISTFVDHQEQRIGQAVQAADRMESDTVRLLLILGLAGVGLAVLTGGWITRSVGRSLTGMALNIDAVAAEILAGTAQQAAGASEQAAAVQQTVATADELAQTAEQSAERARSVADDAQQSAEVAEDGAAAVDESAAAMTDIQQQVDAIAATVVSLAERAQDISGIVDTIEDLAGETHLLALNAAIEAARAGEHGRGFSVVANEVRSLADESKRSTTRIAGILAEIRQGTDTAVMATEQGGKSVAEGVRTVERTGTTIRQLADSVASSAIAAEQISASSGQQAVATAQINTAMRDIGDSAQQNAAAARQAEQAARDLNDVASQLKGLVGAE